jgi:DNA (cytosine-5)-methyltransferase 1
VTLAEARVVSARSKSLPNHVSPALSELDLQMVRAIPPGGNWKDIPVSLPSKRLQQIRESYAAGKGSRSTYYGRLRPDAPAYTVNTYISRPGNGCFVHYDWAGGQHRMISQREAARLQSFPDSFVFAGSKSDVNAQIGNAVPPLLAFQIARTLAPGTAQFVDLFCGAGGLSLGFYWAGWIPLAATDWDAAAAATYAANIHGNVAVGDIRDEAVISDVVAKAEAARNGTRPTWLLGGPPCQGFSTAGRPRSLGDDRNHLYEPYRAALSRIVPDGFVFENVPGLLNMHGGEVLSLIRRELENAGYLTDVWVLRAEEYGIPQRRRRVLIIGRRSHLPGSEPPLPITRFDTVPDALSAVPLVYSASEALSDLPPLVPGQDGSALDYLTEPQNSFQEFVRGRLTPDGLVGRLLAGRR